MPNLIATPIVKNKFWIVESNGNKVATVQAIENGEFVYVNSTNREHFASIKLLSSAHNIEFTKATSTRARSLTTKNEVYGFPVDSKAFNAMWDVKHGFPVFTKLKNSKSFFCAGFYLVNYSDSWVTAYCPKYITLTRYPHSGPYKTQEEMETALNERN